MPPSKSTSVDSELVTISYLDNDLLDSLEKHNVVFDGSLNLVELDDLWDKVVDDVKKVDPTVSLRFLKQRLELLHEQAKTLKGLGKCIGAFLQRVVNIREPSDETSENKSETHSDSESDSNSVTEVSASAPTTRSKTSKTNQNEKEFKEPTYNLQLKKSWMNRFNSKFTAGNKVIYCELRNLQNEVAVIHTKLDQLREAQGKKE